MSLSVVISTRVANHGVVYDFVALMHNLNLCVYDTFTLRMCTDYYVNLGKRDFLFSCNWFELSFSCCEFS